MEFAGRAAAEETDHRHRWLLGTRREGPHCRSTTDKADKFPSLHGRPRHNVQEDQS